MLHARWVASVGKIIGIVSLNLNWISHGNGHAFTLLLYNTHALPSRDWTITTGPLLGHVKKERLIFTLRFHVRTRRVLVPARALGLAMVLEILHREKRNFTNVGVVNI